MKDTSRPHPTSSSRPAPYKKRKASGAISPARRTRRPRDASQHRGYTDEITSPRPPNWAYGSRRDVAKPSRTTPSTDDGRPLSKTGGSRAVPHARGHTSTDSGSARELPSPTSALSIHAGVPGLSLTLPHAFSAPPTLDSFTGPEKTESFPLPDSVTTFLRSIEFPDKPFSAPPLQTSFSLAPSLFQPPSSTGTDDTDKTACTNENGYQVNLVYKGYPFTYDLSALPEDPKGTIALLAITKSDPGAYFLVGAHYRRTGRSRAARAVIRSLLDNLHGSSQIEKGKGDGTLYAYPRTMWFENTFTAAPLPASEIPTVISSPGPSCPKPVDWTAPMFKSAAMRPAMLLLAACELDISREHPDEPEGARHASVAYDLFRAVYGTVNDAIVAGAVRTQPKNALSLEFSSNRNCRSFSPPDSNNHPPNSALPLEAEPQTHIKSLEIELSAARAAQKRLQEMLMVSNERLTCAEGKVHALESHSREVLAQLDECQDENWELRRRLAESEQGTRELAQCTPSAESRVWGRLKELLFDNLGGGVRGE